MPKLSLTVWKPGGLSACLLAGLLLQVLYLFTGAAPAQAEGFVAPPFEQQWNATDRAVATGQVSRTYFWGPQAFAHTSEVYNESPEGQRQVQYFDKARMELSKRPGLDPNYVTNGLLTVELVTGQLQVGDNSFLTRAPSTQPVAGDPLNNANVPTYATFNHGRLTFGTSGAVPAPDRVGQSLNEAIDAAGTISTLPELPRSVKYSRYFKETGHNLADIFDNFFKTAPLGEDKWLAVMGYPITEPFWVQGKVRVGGQPNDVLVQLFQRRVLTYTPANPAGFQVEMGNIGQHYYVWRYNFDVRDALPGNYRVVAAQGKSLLSSSVRKQENIKLGDAGDNIYNLWTTRQSAAFVAAGNNLYLANLTRPGSFASLPLPTGVSNPVVREVGQSADSLTAAALLDSRVKDSNGVLTVEKAAIQVYNPGLLQSNNTALTGTFTAYPDLPQSVQKVRVSADGSYLAFLEGGPAFNQPFWLNIMNLQDRSTRRIKVADYGDRSSLEFIGRSNQLLVSFGNYVSSTLDNLLKVAGRVLQVDATTGNLKTLLEGDTIRSASVSPDGNYFALLTSSDRTEGGIIYDTLSFRKLADPQTILVPTYDQGTSGRQSYEPTLEGWSSDGTAIAVRSSATGTAGVGFQEVSLVSLVTGKPLQQNKTQLGYYSQLLFNLSSPYYWTKLDLAYKGPEAPSEQTISVENLDGSEKLTLFSFKNNETGARLAKMVQVPHYGS
ncbi:MAG TPA: hypothetical protein VH186_19710 [Chloroflexia bacterium]|nr:hypothetical protein [Chloroflexia bacterium]